mmetsp:Transcript_101992/g.297468  ORF Transcript_101992/g.297468 Transcript_101992/m.297468 type:complete len:747 (-) Transcript_101992:93-2333(-)
MDSAQILQSPVALARRVGRQGRRLISGSYKSELLRTGSVLFAPENEPLDQNIIYPCCNRFILREDNPFRMLWSSTVFITLLYTASIFLYRLSFCTFHINADGNDPVGEDDLGWNLVDTFVDYFFLVDLVMHFFHSYRDEKGFEVMSLRLIARNYLLGLFWVNLLACLPAGLVEALLRAFSSDSRGHPSVNRLARLARLNRMARLPKLLRLSRFFQFVGDSREMRLFRSMRGFRVLSVITLLLACLHLLACFWYLCAALHDDPRETWVGRRSVDASGTSLLEQSPLEQWLVSMYFVLTVFTTVGFGDISAGTEAEIIVAGFIMVVGAIVHSIIVSEVISIITSFDQKRTYIDKHSKLIDAFSDHTMLDESTRMAIKNEITWRAKTESVRQGFSKEEITGLITSKMLPRKLLTQMTSGVFQGCLLRSKLIACCRIVAIMPPRLPVLLAAYVAWVEFDVGEPVYQMHDFAFNLFLVMSGTFAYLARPTPNGGVDEMEETDEPGRPLRKQPTGGLSAKFTAAADHMRQALMGAPGSLRKEEAPLEGPLYPYKLFSYYNYFGDVEVMRSCPRVATARCETGGVALALHKSDLARLQQQFPQFSHAWDVAARNHERARQRCRQRLTQGQPLRQYAAQAIQSFFRTLGRQRLAMSRNCSQGSFGGKGVRFPGPDKCSEAVPDLANVGMAAMQKVDELQGSMDAMRKDFRSFRGEIRELRSEMLSVRGEIRGALGQAHSQGGDAQAQHVSRDYL